MRIPPSSPLHRPQNKSVRTRPGLVSRRGLRECLWNLAGCRRTQHRSRCDPVESPNDQVAGCAAQRSLFSPSGCFGHPTPHQGGHGEGIGPGQKMVQKGPDIRFVALRTGQPSTASLAQKQARNAPIETRAQCWHGRCSFGGHDGQIH
jgi:hypothetical protein